MGNQRTFASMVWNGKGKITRREWFLAEMDAVIPVAAAGQADRAALPENGTRSPAAGTGEDAADFTSCSSGSTCPTRRPKTRSTTVSRCVQGKYVHDPALIQLSKDCSYGLPRLEIVAIVPSNLVSSTVNGSL
jgi:hypothetical protein